MQTEAILRRLVFVKYLLRLASQEARKPEPLCASAVLLLHDTSELVLQLGAEHRNVGSKKTDFMQYFDFLDAALAPDKLEHRESMRRLNDARVGLKHHGTMPSRREVLSFDTMVAGFCRDNIPRLVGVSFDDVSLADLIIANEPRMCLKRADDAFKGNNLDEATMAIAEAFERLLRDRGISQYLGSGLKSDIQALERQLDSSGRVGPLSKLAEAVDVVHQEVALMRQGIDTRRLTVFRALMPHVMIAMAGNARFSFAGGREPPTLDELQFCYDFVVDSALRIEDVHSVTADLGADRRLYSRFGAI